MKIAVVGAGISGLGAAWILGQKHEVHLFESEPRLGGHAHTVTVQESAQKSAQDATNSVPIDTGFLVYNEVTYPHLCGFFESLGVETCASDMSLSVRAQHKNLEWSGTNLDTVFAQRTNLFRPSFLRMIRDILKFDKDSTENLELSKKNQWSLKQLIEHRSYSHEFCRDYLMPIGAAIWSTPEVRMEDFPAETFIAFFINHKLLQIKDRPVWRTVKNGSIEYVKRVAEKIRFVHLGSPVDEVNRNAQGLIDLRVGERTWQFDRVVFATHAPVTAKILKNQDELESKILSAVQTKGNRTLLHQDESFMPVFKKCWSAWNVFSTNKYHEAPAVSLSYYSNKLQPLLTKQNYFVTLNPSTEVRGVLREFNYHHPQFNREAIEAQQLLPQIQGRGGVYYAGAWTRYGFHEDGLLSAVKVGELFDLAPPWTPRGVNA